MPITAINLELSLPFLTIGGTWVPNEAEKRAAWELLIELVTRTTVVPLAENEGILREALASMYAVFGVTRDVLRRHGPDAARDKGTGNPSIATLSATVLNAILRPMLSEWHPKLRRYEEERPPDMGEVEWESAWDQAPILREELNEVRAMLRQYVDVLGEAADAKEFAAAVTPRRNR